MVYIQANHFFFVDAEERRKEKEKSLALMQATRRRSHAMVGSKTITCEKDKIENKRHGVT